MPAARKRPKTLENRQCDIGDAYLKKCHIARRLFWPGSPPRRARLARPAHALIPADPRRKAPFSPKLARSNAPLARLPLLQFRRRVCYNSSMSREALVLLVCCCDFRDGAERLIPSKSLRNAVIRAFPGLFRILRMCAPRRAAAVVRPRGREKSADRRRRILISRLLIIRASVPRWKSPFPAYFKGFPAVSPLIPPYPAFLKYPVSPHAGRKDVFHDALPRRARHPARHRAGVGPRRSGNAAEILRLHRLQHQRQAHQLRVHRPHRR